MVGFVERLPQRKGLLCIGSFSAVVYGNAMIYECLFMPAYVQQESA